MSVSDRSRRGILSKANSAKGTNVTWLQPDPTEDGRLKLGSISHVSYGYPQ